MKNELYVTNFYSQLVYETKQQLQLTPLKKSLRVFFAGHTSIFISIETLDFIGAKLFKNSEHRAALAIVLKVKILKQFLLGRPTTITQISFCTRRGDPKNSISYHHQMGSSSNGIQLWVEEHNKTADTSSRRFEHNWFWRKQLWQLLSVFRNQ